MEISFNGKIPVSTCNIYNKRRRKFVEATVYEIDCKDKKDADYIRNIGGNWKYKEQIVQGIKRKHNRLTGENASFWNNAEKNSIEDNRYFALVAPKEEIICICETEPFGNEVDISVIESKKDRHYKYAGQTMLATIAKSILGRDKKLTVKAPSNDAVIFYENKCHFRKNRKYFGYELPQEDIQDFIQRTENRTNGKIISYIA